MKKQHRIWRAAALLLALATAWTMCAPAIAQEALTESQLQQIYSEAYATETAGLDAYIDDYVAHFDPAEYRQRQTHKMTEPIRDMASSSYQYVVDNYPEVAQYYANKVGSNFGGLSPLVSDATYDILTDQEASAVFGEMIGGALEFMDAFSYAMDQAEKNPNPQRAVVVLQSPQYTVLRSSGTLSEVLGVKMDAANSIKIRIYGLQERKALLQESVNRYQQAYDVLVANGDAPEEELQALSITIRSGQGMVDAVADRLAQEGQALEDELETWSGRFDGQPAGGETADDYAIYNIIDNGGNLTGAFCTIPNIVYGHGLISNRLSLRLSKLGMVSFQRNGLDDSMIIIDKTGKILHQNRKGVYYSNITPSGNVLKISEQSDFDNGDHYLLEVVRPDGSVAAEVGRAQRDSLYINEESTLTTENDRLFDSIESKMGTLMRRFPYKDSCYLRWQKVNGETVQGVLDLATGAFDASQPFNDDYAMDGNGLGAFDLPASSSSRSERAPASSSARANAGGVVVAGYVNVNSEYRLRQSDFVLCDRMNKPIVKLDAGGGAHDIYQDAEGLYWIVTNSGYYYIIDPNNDWRVLFRPMAKIGTGAATAFIDAGLAVQTESGVNVYGKEGTLLFSCPGATLENGWGNYLGSNETGWYDMASGEVLNVAIPESGITFLHIDG